MATKELSPTGQKVLAGLLEEVDKYKAQHEVFIKGQKEKSESKDGQKQLHSWVKGIQTGNTKDLQAISQEIEQEYKSQNVTTPADGGYLVPTVIANNIVEKLKLTAPLRQFFTEVPNAPAKFTVPSQVARPTVAWTAEEAAYNATKLTVGPTTINAFKTTGIVPLTEEFEADTQNANATIALLEDQLAQEIAIQENIAFISGDGTSRPYGFRNLTLTGAQTANTTHASVTYDTIKTLLRGLTQANRRGTFFLANDKIETKLDTLKDTTNRYIYDDSVKESDFARLLGRPFINADEHTADEMWHINGRGYVITDVAGIRIDFGLATGDFESGRRSLRVMKRTGGAPVLNECFAKLVFTA